MKTLGIAVLIIGLGLSIFSTFRYFTTEKIVELGTVEITREKPHNISWSPLLGVVFIAVGGAMLWRGTIKKQN